MGKLFKKVLSVADPIGSAIARKNKKTWFGKYHGKFGSWGYLRKKFGIKNPLTTSAKGVATSSGGLGYGVTGSIVGKY